MIASARDTIVAIATATGGGIGIVRVSGPAASRIASAIVAPWPSAPESHRLYHGWAHHPSTGEPLDEVLACWMRAPHSYTGEDVVEFHGHGGAASLARLLAATTAVGARLAEPGEFTRRAFLNGRIDLTRAEAVAEVIAARSAQAARVAQAHLRGAIADRIAELRARLVAILAEVEARIDFPEEDLDFQSGEGLVAALGELRAAVEALASSYARGRRLVEGVDVVLVGRPNAGKSSLFNALAGEERALVDEQPGTTRDFIEAEVDLDGMRAVLVDTAGEREEDAAAIERRGMALARRRRERADLVVVVIDGIVGFNELEARLVAEASASVVVWNKCDRMPPPPPRELPVEVVAASARTGEGLEGLKRTIRARVEGVGEEAPVTVTSARQKGTLDEAGAALDRAVGALADGHPPELAAVDLRIALERFKQVTGDAVGDDVIERVFARFCIGK